MQQAFSRSKPLPIAISPLISVFSFHPREGREGYYCTRVTAIKQDNLSQQRIQEVQNGSPPHPDLTKIPSLSHGLHPRQHRRPRLYLRPPIIRALPRLGPKPTHKPPQPPTDAGLRANPDRHQNGTNQPRHQAHHLLPAPRGEPSERCSRRL